MISKKINTLLIGYCLILILSACASKLTSPNLTKLESREAVLALNTKLNNLNLALEREKLSLSSLTTKVEEINKEASESAAKAKQISEDLSKNPGDLKLSSKANSSAKAAAKDAKKAAKLNDELGKSNDKIKEYQNDIVSVTAELKELESKIEFSPTNTNQ